MTSPRKRSKRIVTIGQEITCPRGIAAGGMIRIRSQRAAQVATWFDLGKRRQDGDEKTATESQPAQAMPALQLRPGTITLITGPSGAGKSTLLRATRGAAEHRERTWIDLADLAEPDLPLVDCFGQEKQTPLKETIGLLARVGLGEVWTFLRTPAELSDGQRWRLRLALAIHEAQGPGEGGDGPSDRPIIACDEFAALLDRVTARIIAHRLRRAIDTQPHVAAVLATSHEDVEVPLAPEVVVRCDFGRFETTDGHG